MRKPVIISAGFPSATKVAKTLGVKKRDLREIIARAERSLNSARRALADVHPEAKPRVGQVAKAETGRKLPVRAKVTKHGNAEKANLTSVPSRNAAPLSR
jgi:hypothetical protein